MANTDVSLCTAALLLLGESAITSFDDDDNGAICSAIYPVFRDGLLSGYPWSFVKVKAQLSQTTDVPTTTWSYQYQLPTDRLTAPWAVYNTDGVGVAPIRNYEVMTDKLLANDAEIWIDYFARPEEAKWPPYFVMFFVNALAAALAMPVTQDASLAAKYEQDAYGLPGEGKKGGLWASATLIDSQITPSRVIISNPLAEARFS